MAIDTEAKRRAALTVGNPGLLPAPSGSLSDGERAGLLGVYQWIEAVASAVADGLLWLVRRRRQAARRRRR